MNFRGRRELQGPRPSPLRINKDPHKIKKPPLAPQPSLNKPLIIYTVSPKIIHTTPSDFMSLVQQLTGSSSSSNSTSLPSSDMVTKEPMNPSNNGGSEISHAVRYGTIENAGSPLGNKQFHPSKETGDVKGSIPSSFFSAPAPASATHPSMLTFVHGLSPDVHSNGNFMDGGFIMSRPSNLVSPNNTPILDIFNNLLD